MESAYDYVNNLIKEGFKGKKVFHNITKEKYLIKGIGRNYKTIRLKIYNLNEKKEQLLSLENLVYLKIIK